MAGIQLNVIILSPIRLLGDSLAACLKSTDDIAVCAVVDRFSTQAMRRMRDEPWLVSAVPVRRAR